ncbi:MAG: hypothetical protein Q8R83_07630 [Legionellaceae bacterium]|nr:hypothetical protein [Legionellaceae bacterium]
MKRKNELKYRVISGPEIETLADYWGQGKLGVSYYTGFDKTKNEFHALAYAYDNLIAKSEDPDSQLSMSTDCNRSGNGNRFPLRIGIEFRADPGSERTNELLHLVNAYDTWLTQTKATLRTQKYSNYNNPSRIEERPHDVSLNDFIDYYNGLDTTKEKLIIQIPRDACTPSSLLEFKFDFPEDAEWVLRFEHKDLNPEYHPIFYTQYNLSIPVGFVFDPKTKNTFRLQSKFDLVLNEKEFADDFNESRPHAKFFDYERQITQQSVQLADKFFNDIKAPNCAFGIKDFLRGMAYEIGMISTSKNHLITLFQDDALWTLQNQQELKNNSEITYTETQKIYKIAENISKSLKKSLFPYFMKATLATFFKQLHPYEKELLRNVTKNQIKRFCQNAVMLANGGEGNNDKHPSHFIIKGKCFMEKFGDFYEETFSGNFCPENDLRNDPIGWLSCRFIEPENIGLSHSPIKAMVVEVRMPEQGNQQYPALATLCDQYPKKLEKLLATKVPYIRTCRNELNELWKNKKINNKKTEQRIHSTTYANSMILLNSRGNAPKSEPKLPKKTNSNPLKPITKQHTNKEEPSYEKFYIWHSKRKHDEISSRTRQSTNTRRRLNK